jgi:hypothetical protein
VTVKYQYLKSFRDFSNGQDECEDKRSSAITFVARQHGTPEAAGKGREDNHRDEVDMRTANAVLI